jgi:hypothetical protein
MRILVLDTIHGGNRLAPALEAQGHAVAAVDVYRGLEGIPAPEAALREWDLLVAPVHLDPAYPLFCSVAAPSITHHQAARWVLGKARPQPLVEITGSRGKTTTAYALARAMGGSGILHTSRGTFSLPGMVLTEKTGITPSDLVSAARRAYGMHGWCIAEVSLGFTGAGDLGILTSSEDYRFASGKKSALAEKLRSGQHLPRLLVPPGIGGGGNRVAAGTIARVKGDTCSYREGDIRGEFSSPLLRLTPYRLPLVLAAAACCLLGRDPGELSGFAPVEGRMAISREGGIAVVDDSNSGTGARTAREAASYARRESGPGLPLTLVIGKEGGAVCEGFPAAAIREVIRDVCPGRVILVGDEYRDMVREGGGPEYHWCRTLDEGRSLALQVTDSGSIVLAVKTWR